MQKAIKHIIRLILGIFILICIYGMAAIIGLLFEMFSHDEQIIKAIGLGFLTVILGIFAYYLGSKFIK